jgi:hypothetical protein
VGKDAATKRGYGNGKDPGAKAHLVAKHLMSELKLRPTKQSVFPPVKSGRYKGKRAGRSEDRRLHKRQEALAVEEWGGGEIVGYGLAQVG